MVDRADGDTVIEVVNPVLAGAIVQVRWPDRASLPRSERGRARAMAPDHSTRSRSTSCGSSRRLIRALLAGAGRRGSSSGAIERVINAAALWASAAMNAQPPGGSTALLRSAVKSTSASGYVDRGYLMSQGQWIGP